MNWYDIMELEYDPSEDFESEKIYEGRYDQDQYVKLLYKKGFSINRICSWAEIEEEKVRYILGEWDE